MNTPKPRQQILVGAIIAAMVVPFIAHAEGATRGARVHSADVDADGRIGLSELLRLIQFFNVGAHGCQSGTEDGYAPGPGDESCAPHDNDYIPQDWRISLEEALRAIQLFNADGYEDCLWGEDSYCLPNAPPPPNVLMLCLDTLRDDRVGGTRNGVPISPFLDAYAQGGVRFSRAYVPGGWTRPALSAIYTGLYAETHRELRGAEGNVSAAGYAMGEEFETMPEWFTRHGYDTWCVQTNRNSGAEFGFDRGFPEGQYQQNLWKPAFIITEQGLDIVEQVQEPFFLYMQYFDPHAVFRPPVEYSAIFGPPPVVTPQDNFLLIDQVYREFVVDLYLSWLNDTPPAYQPFTEAGEELLRYRYEAEIRYMDDELSRLIETIEAMYPNTIVVIFSDHGEALLDRDVVGHAHSLFDELVRVPTIVKGPGITPGVEDRPVELLGLLPTLSNYLGVPPNPAWQGMDIFDPNTASEPIFTYTEDLIGGGFLEATGVILGDYKMITGTKFPSPALFNVVNDPGELNDIAAEEPAKTAELKALIDAHVAAYPRSEDARRPSEIRWVP